MSKSNKKRKFNDDSFATATGKLKQLLSKKPPKPREKRLTVVVRNTPRGKRKSSKGRKCNVCVSPDTAKPRKLSVCEETERTNNFSVNESDISGVNQAMLVDSSESNCDSFMPKIVGKLILSLIPELNDVMLAFNKFGIILSIIIVVFFNSCFFRT